MKVALFFGSFNPIHVGHLIIASTMAEHSGVERVWFVVSPHNPLKPKPSLLNEYDRLRLVELAVEEDDRFQSSNVEFSLPQPSYTADTLAYLTEQFPNYEFCLIMGSDNLKTLKKWKNYEVLLKHYPILVYKRHDHQPTELDEHPNVHPYNMALLDISASYIREEVKAGRSIRYLVPDKVWQYIEEMGLYK